MVILNNREKKDFGKVEKSQRALLNLSTQAREKGQNVRPEKNTDD